MLMNNTLSSDKVMQQMYRCMTEGEDKKIGFVVDLNISRVVNTCIDYTIHKNNKSIDEKIKYLIRHVCKNLNQLFWLKTFFEYILRNHTQYLFEL